MSYLKQNVSEEAVNGKKKFYKRGWFKIIIGIIIILGIAGGIFAWKTGGVLNKISEGGLIKSLVHNIPGVKDELKGQKEGRVNILLLGMRGVNMSGGGNLADTIILASINIPEKKVSMISIPRDLYVTVPGTSDKQKINAVHHYGEEKGGKGMEDMKNIVGEITGLPIHYAVRINFSGFKQLVDAIGGLDITLDQPFEEAMQFNEAHVCDENIFTIPFKNDKNLQMYECKYSFRDPSRITAGTSYALNPPAFCYNKPTESGYVKVRAQYPLCTNSNPECGGDFKIPAGKQTLSGEQALCYVRSRTTSNDFERAKRQQMVIKLLKEKMLSIGTLSDFSKINGMLNALGDNVKTDMELWEMQELYGLYKEMPEAQIYQRVLENSEEGLLYHPEDSNGAGYILLPMGDNYDKIREMAKNIFSLPPQSDIKPK